MRISVTHPLEFGLNPACCITIRAFIDGIAEFREISIHLPPENR
jgi:hypothetical protein